MRLRADWVAPISGPVLEDAEVVTEGSLIAEVRRRRVDGLPVTGARDLGSAVILPGLVNAHAHIEYTVLRGLVEDLPMLPWVMRLTEAKALLEPRDWVASALLGAAECARGGVTTVADCTDSGAALDGLVGLGLRGVVFQEVFGIDEAVPVKAAVAALDGKLKAMAAAASGSHVVTGVSPHTIYTVRPALMRALCEYAERKGLPLCIHVAESRSEVELALSGTGEIADRFERRAVRWIAPGRSVIGYLGELGALRTGTLLAHCVHISAKDAEALRTSGAAVAHCPKSNAKLGNGTAPLSYLAHCTQHSPADRDASSTAAGSRYARARLGIGTDGAPSNNKLDLIEDLRFGVLLQRAARHRADRPTARDLVEVATIGGARALGMEREIGTLEPGKAADLTAVGLQELGAFPAYDPYSAIVYSCCARDVLLTMVAGSIVSERSRLGSGRVGPARRRALIVAERLRNEWTKNGRTRARTVTGEPPS